jgi:hypothetical protein
MALMYMVFQSVGDTTQMDRLFTMAYADGRLAKILKGRRLATLRRPMELDKANVFPSILKKLLDGSKRSGMRDIHPKSLSCVKHLYV